MKEVFFLQISELLGKTHFSLFFNLEITALAVNFESKCNHLFSLVNYTISTVLVNVHQQKKTLMMSHVHVSNFDPKILKTKKKKIRAQINTYDLIDLDGWNIGAL